MINLAEGAPFTFHGAQKVSQAEFLKLVLIYSKLNRCYQTGLHSIVDWHITFKTGGYLLPEGQIYQTGQQEDWTNVEAQHSFNGALPSYQGINSQIYHAQIQDCDARKAEALILYQAADPLLTLRSLLFRGRFQEAQNLITQLKIKTQRDDTQFAKVLVEEARLSAFAGQWSQCLLLCKEVMGLQLPPITRLTVLQITALAHFELGQMDHAKANLNLVDSMSRLFPKSITVFYANLLKIRIQAREMGTLVGAQRIKEAWLNFISTSGDIDQLQALLRVEVDLKRLSNQPHFSFAFASYLVAECMGEELYVALGLFDCFYSADRENRPLYLRLMNEMAPNYQRLQNIIKESHGQAPPTTSVQTALRYFESIDQNAMLAAAEVYNQEGYYQRTPAECNILILPSYELLLTLTPFKITSLQKSKQFVKVFETLFYGVITKTDFFKKIWGSQKYAPDLHDSLIYTLLYRMKKLTGVKVVINEGVLCLENALIIL